MYLGIDIGGTKTLLAVFDERGKIVDEQRFPTAKNYPSFIKALDKVLKSELSQHHIAAVCCALPGRIDRKAGVGISFHNLPGWHEVPMKHDLEEILPSAKVLIENDAKLAGLSEALLVQNQYKKVLYITLSTGIGVGLILKGQIPPEFSDIEIGSTVLEYDGRLQRWEDFASGKALRQRYGRLASEITETRVWKKYAFEVALGLNEAIKALDPDVVIVGGGVGTHFAKFDKYLHEELLKLNDEGIDLPPLIKAQRPEEAVIYGCYDYIRQKA